MNKIATRYIFIITVISGFLLSIFLFAEKLHENHLIDQGNELVAMIETYKKNHGYFPAFLSDLDAGEKLEGPLYYERKDKTYIIWFGKALGESKTYDSDTKKWN